jgi:hypothetical protein
VGPRVELERAEADAAGGRHVWQVGGAVIMPQPCADRHASARQRPIP